MARTLQTIGEERIFEGSRWSGRSRTCGTTLVTPPTVRTGCRTLGLSLAAGRRLSGSSGRRHLYRAGRCRSVDGLTRKSSTRAVLHRASQPEHSRPHPAEPPTRERPIATEVARHRTDGGRSIITARFPRWPRSLSARPRSFSCSITRAALARRARSSAKNHLEPDRSTTSTRLGPIGCATCSVPTSA